MQLKPKIFYTYSYLLARVAAHAELVAVLLESIIVSNCELVLIGDRQLTKISDCNNLSGGPTDRRCIGDAFAM